MAYLIDSTSFKGELEIPNLDEANSKSLTELNRLIDEKCRLLMIDVLGSENYEDLGGLLVAGLLPDSAPDKWKLLVNGGVYTTDDVQHTWFGIKSMLAWYVYAQYVRDNVSYLSGVGEVRAEAKNAANVNSTQRYVYAWNKFVELYQGNVCSLNWQYPHIYHVSGNYNYNRLGGFLNFLANNVVDFPNTVLRQYDAQNQLGL